MVYLGLDYGSRHLGVAISVGALAEPLDTINAAKPLPRLIDLIAEYQPDALVIGLPDGSQKQPAEQFIASLKKLGLPVHVVDETLSSHDARQALLHKSQIKRKSKEHAVAAALILQSYLDTSQNMN